MSEKIRIVIVDDHPLFREGVAMSLSSRPDLEIVGQGGTGEAALRLGAALIPDIMLLDIGIPGGGIATAQLIGEACASVKIIMLTASDDQENLLAALRVGARAYVLKGVSASELDNIIHGVAAGEGYITPAMANSLLFELGNPIKNNPQNSDTLVTLTERERSILELVALGLSNKEIGGKLFLSEKTIKHYMTNILQKLNVRNRVEAALLVQKVLAKRN